MNAKEKRPKHQRLRRFLSLSGLCKKDVLPIIMIVSNQRI